MGRKPKTTGPTARDPGAFKSVLVRMNIEGWRAPKVLAVEQEATLNALAVEAEQWHRRHALTLASMLPDGRDDAMAVLECVGELVTAFLQADAPEPAKAKIVTLVRDCQDLSA
jgi:hypothetical protein